MIKQIMYLVVWSVIKKKESEWFKIYERLVPRLWSYDERTRAYQGKGKVIGRTPGQMIGMMYAFLKKDLETVKGLAPGEKPPDPMRYDPEVHRLHQAGYYRSLKPGTRPRSLIPIRILNTHIEMGKSHHGRDSFFVIGKFIESLAEHFNERIE
jgi:hypothetical protein